MPCPQEVTAFPLPRVHEAIALVPAGIARMSLQYESANRRSARDLWSRNRSARHHATKNTRPRRQPGLHFGTPWFAIVARGWYGSVEAKANIVRAVLSRELPVVGNVDGNIGGLLVSYEGFQRLADNERARANGRTRTIC